MSCLKTWTSKDKKKKSEVFRLNKKIVYHINSPDCCNYCFEQLKWKMQQNILYIDPKVSLQKLFFTQNRLGNLDKNHSLNFSILIEWITNLIICKYSDFCQAWLGLCWQSLGSCSTKYDWVCCMRNLMSFDWDDLHGIYIAQNKVTMCNIMDDYFFSFTTIYVTMSSNCVWSPKKYFWRIHGWIHFKECWDKLWLLALLEAIQ